MSVWNREAGFKLMAIVLGAVLVVAPFMMERAWAHGVHPGSCDLPGYDPALHEHVNWLDEL